MWIELFIHSTGICHMPGTLSDTREDAKRENMIQLGRGSSRQSSEENQLFGTREALGMNAQLLGKLPNLSCPQFSHL